MVNDLFSTDARQCIEFARDEATRLRHDYIGTEHLLLGIIRHGNGKATEALLDAEINLNELRESIEEVVQPCGGTLTMAILPLTARSKKVLEIAGQEQRAMKSADIEPEHIFLALLKDEEGVAAQVLSMYDYDYKDAYEFLTDGKIVEPGRKRTEFPFSEPVINVLDNAREEAVKNGNSSIVITHLLLGFINQENDPASDIIKNSVADLEKLKLDLERIIAFDPKSRYEVDTKQGVIIIHAPITVGKPKLSKGGKEIFIRALAIARNRDLEAINTTSLLLSISRI